VPAAANSSIAKVRVGGREYVAVTERNCLTCNSPYREEVERQTIEGRTWARIVDSLPDDAKLTARNLSDHWRNDHLPVHEATVVAIAEQQAIERGEVITAGVERTLDHLEFARALVGRVRQRVINGEVEPDIRDALRAMEFLAKFESEPSWGEQDIVEAFIAYHETAAELMTAEQFAEFGRRLEQNATLNELAQRWDQATA
jgi:hypothetical protein